MLKTLKKVEFDNFRKFLIPYYQHLKDNYHTMISQIYSLHELKHWKNNRYESVYLCVMGNMFSGDLEITKRYDLKGSTYNR